MACSFVKNMADSVGGGDLSLYVEGERRSKGELLEHGNLTEELLADKYIDDLDRPTGDIRANSRERAPSAGLTRSRYEHDGSFSYAEGELDEAMSHGERGSFNPVNEHTNHGCLGRTIHIVTYPMVFFLSCILMDCRKYPKYYWLTFFTR